MTAATEWTRSEIDRLLNKCDRAVERAIVAIFKFQTVAEQQAEFTEDRNGVGFDSANAKKGSYYANWVMSGRKLTGNHRLRPWLRRVQGLRLAQRASQYRMACPHP